MTSSLFVNQQIGTPLRAAAWSLRLAAIVVALMIVPGPAAAANCGKDLAPLVEAKMAELGVPGVVVYVDVPGVCHWTATLGTGDVTKGQAIGLGSHVRVGSITKSMLGTVVLQLVDEGRVRLDNPVSTYLTGVPNGDAITVRHMLQMSSGLYNYSEALSFNQSLDANPQRVWTLDELLAIGLNEAPYFTPPGTGFHYSNTNSILLGRLVETITGNPLAREFERRLFRPLHMTGSSLPALDDATIPRPHPRGYTFGTNVGTLPGSCDAETVGRHDVTNASPSWTWAAGGVISTLHDLTIWARALGLGTLLSPALRAERLQGGPQPVGAPHYGLHIANFFGVIGHDGALPGFNSFIGYAPAKDATIVVLANVFPDAECTAPADEITKVLGRRLELFNLP